MIEAVLFDMGGTLETYSFSEEMRRQATPELHNLLVSFGIDPAISDEELYQVISTGLKKYKSFSVSSEQELTSERIWTEYLLKDFPQYHPLLKNNSEALMYWLDINFYSRKLRSEVPQVLSDLKNLGYKLGLISNITSLSQVPENLKEYGILDYFSVIILSSEFGRRKPDPAIFHHAASKIGTPASRCAYVGDRIVRDIIGARRAGYGLAIQIVHDFEHGESDEGPAPDAIVHNLLEISDVIEKYDQKCKPSDNQAVKAVFFDAGDILYYRPRRGQPLAEFLAQNGINHPELFRQKVSVVKEKAFNGALNREEYFEELIRAYGIVDPNAIENGKQLLAQADDDVIFFDGVADTLRKLKRSGFLLGIITDTAVPTSDKLRWFESGGFGDVWDAYISSRDIGVQKPDRKIYEAALNQFDIQPHQACFVGHDQEELSGASQIGMHTISFNADPDAVADLNAEHFSDLLVLVHQIPTGVPQ